MTSIIYKKYKCLTERALDAGLYFRPVKKCAFVSGAGIAAFGAAFELLSRGFKVVIGEKRTQFTRFNIINLNVETQSFLKKFNLLEKFETYVAARIKEHRYVLIDKAKCCKGLGIADVSDLRLDEGASLAHFDTLFNKDGIYSVPIGILQTFLAENALECGARIFGGTTVQIISRTSAGGVGKVQITADRILEPDLFFIAEGAHSTTALQLGMRQRVVTNVCSGENWIFGNMAYSGRKSFVVSLIDTSGKTLRIANAIFNAKSHAINIAVTSDKMVCEESIRRQIEETAAQVLAQEAYPIEKMETGLLSTTRTPVHVVNRTCVPFSRDNVFCIGDAAGVSSPLAGLGGTLGLTLVPLTVRQLLDDYQRQSTDLHKNFHEFSESYTGRWIQKSETIKKFCLSKHGEK